MNSIYNDFLHIFSSPFFIHSYMRMCVHYIDDKKMLLTYFLTSFISKSSEIFTKITIIIYLCTFWHIFKQVFITSWIGNLPQSNIFVYVHTLCKHNSKWNFQRKRFSSQKQCHIGPEVYVKKVIRVNKSY